MSNTRNIDCEHLKSFLKELFCKGGMNITEAEYFGETLVQSNLWGIDSHGVIRTKAYFERILCNAINTKANMKIEQKAAAMTLLDADGAAGCVAGHKAMNIAVENAQKCGIGLCGVTNSNHFGAAALYSKIAADKGMIGISMTNVLPLIAAPGALAPVGGNNPLSIAIPTYAAYPFLLDMSLSVVAGGKLHLASAKNEKIPKDWAVDKNGQPTDDPKEALAGFLLPMGGYKGLGLSYAIDILSGLITGGAYADKMKSMYANPKDPSLTGHLMIAINICNFISKDEMQCKMQDYHDFIESIPMAEGYSKLVFPGERESKTMAERLLSGVPVPNSTIEELNTLAETYELKCRL